MPDGSLADPEDWQQGQVWLQLSNLSKEAFWDIIFFIVSRKSPLLKYLLTVTSLGLGANLSVAKVYFYLVVMSYSIRVLQILPYDRRL